jgi:hypothetical protein
MFSVVPVSSIAGMTPMSATGHAELHDERIQEALELACHHHVNHRECQQDGDDEVAGGLLLFLPRAAEDD